MADNPHALQNLLAATLRDAADHMVVEQVGRLPVVWRDEPRIVVGILSRSDLLAAHAPRLEAAHRRTRYQGRSASSSSRSLT